MGDLIVKPAIGLGNSLKIQDQAGQECFSTVDDGATLTDKVSFPSGMVIQVQSKRNTSGDSGTETSWTNTGITMEITPKLASS